ncbi:Uncharacterised protein [Lysinibacillus sphaericus]|nr:Uncharacterised protein [Lysinibacillus sphaericus]
MYYEIKLTALRRNGYIDADFMIDGQKLFSSRINRKNWTDTELVNALSREFGIFVSYELQTRINRNGTVRRAFKVPERCKGSIEVFVTGDIDVSDDEVIELFRLHQASNGIVYVSRME